MIGTAVQHHLSATARGIVARSGVLPHPRHRTPSPPRGLRSTSRGFRQASARGGGEESGRARAKVGHRERYRVEGSCSEGCREEQTNTDRVAGNRSVRQGLASVEATTVARHLKTYETTRLARAMTRDDESSTTRQKRVKESLFLRTRRQWRGVRDGRGSRSTEGSREGTFLSAGRSRGGCSSTRDVLLRR